MKFRLNGSVTFSKDAKDAESDISEFINQANSEILLKGLGSADESEAARITEWELDGDKLNLTIESGYKIRAHDGLLRIKNPLSQLLGKKYHLGVRKLHIDEYEVTIPIGEGEYSFDLDSAKQFTQLEDIKIKDGAVSFLIKDLDESIIKKQSVNRIIKQVAKKQEEIAIGEDGEELDITYKLNATPGEIIAESEEFETYFEGDMTEESMKRGWVKPFPGKGQWFYGPEITALERALEEIIVERVIEKIGFQECLFPKLIPINVMEKMKYLEGLPEGMYYVSAPKRDPETFTQFKNELIVNKEVPIDLLKEGLKDPGYVNAAAQCEPFYQFFSHEVIDESELPIKFYDKSGWTYRWEGGGAKGLDRVHEFQRIECVWMGSPEEVTKIRDATRDLSHELANELELEWYTEIGDDPFYLEGRKQDDRGIEYPDVAKYEMRLKIPGQEKGVAVVSANVHGTHFIEGFSIKEAHGHKIWTGCTGFGITRWVFGFISQKGFDKENWPQLVKDKLKEAKSPKVLTWP
ncbi:MAG: serine--tRNA ligase [Methanobrevibacter sp.]|uniref:serine--tRNA ligase n=1 Tax=Methanobrevibacter sp. TaxID=66852 RepID=UPI0026E0A04F|nr:serine--tRNA ligase [Methanobrevibacter sp.]MDO5848166.1 serine--tRNA ligase [Methanobrevibacter sp.]